MKKWGLQIGVVAALAIAAFVFRGRDRLPATPEAAVTALFETASRGDDEGYLRLVSGELRTSLENARSQAGVAGFRETLRRSAAGIKGLAVTRGSDAPPGLVALDVEIVFADRNERQRMFLADKGGGWAIASIAQASMVKPAIPYGTPVFEDQPAPAAPAATPLPTSATTSPPTGAARPQPAKTPIPLPAAP